MAGVVENGFDRVLLSESSNLLSFAQASHPRNKDQALFLHIRRVLIFETMALLEEGIPKRATDRPICV